MEGKAACSGKSWLLSTGAERKYYNDSELILRYSVASPRVNKTSVLETDCISSEKLRPHTDSNGLPERAVEGNEDHRDRYVHNCYQSPDLLLRREERILHYTFVLK